MEYRSIMKQRYAQSCVCVYAKTIIIASRMGPVCQDRRKLQPVVQEPNTEDSVPDILWKAAMVGAGVGCMLPRHLWSFIVIHGPYMGVHDYSWPSLVLHVASWSFYSWSIHILERNHTRAAWLDCWNLFAFHQRPSGFQVSLLDVVRCCKILFQHRDGAANCLMCLSLFFVPPQMLGTLFSFVSLFTVHRWAILCRFSQIQRQNWWRRNQWPHIYNYVRT